MDRTVRPNSETKQWDQTVRPNSEGDRPRKTEQWDRTVRLNSETEQWDRTVRPNSETKLWGRPTREGALVLALVNELGFGSKTKQGDQPVRQTMELQQMYYQRHRQISISTRQTDQWDRSWTEQWDQSVRPNSETKQWDQTVRPNSEGLINCPY